MFVGNQLWNVRWMIINYTKSSWISLPLNSTSLNYNYYKFGISNLETETEFNRHSQWNSEGVPKVTKS